MTTKRLLIYVAILVCAGSTIIFRDGVAGVVFASARAVPVVQPTASLLAEEKRYRVVGRNVSWLAGVTLDGEAWTLASHAGRVVVLEFWNSWSGVPVGELRRSNELARKLSANPQVDWVGVSLGGEQAGAIEVAAEAEMVHPQLFEPRTVDLDHHWRSSQSIATVLEVNRLPGYCIIDGTGRVVDVDVSFGGLEQRVLVLLTQE